MGIKYLDRLKTLPSNEAVYYLIGKMIGAFGLGILLANWFDISTFLGWILLVLGIALSFPPGMKLLKKQKADKTEKKQKR